MMLSSRSGCDSRERFAPGLASDLASGSDGFADAEGGGAMIGVG